MPFTKAEIEEGTGKPGALVFATTDQPVTSPIDEAVLYLVRRGKMKFSQAGLQQESFVLIGTEYVDLLAHDRVQGHPRVHLQGLLQPRRGQHQDHSRLPDDEIPTNFLHAVFEAIELAASGEKLFDVIDTDRTLKRQKTGRSLEKEWFQGGKTSLKRYHAVTKLLDPILAPLGELARG